MTPGHRRCRRTGCVCGAGRNASAIGQYIFPASILVERLRADAHAAYARRERELGSDVMRAVERRIISVVMDACWARQLEEMDLLYEYSLAIAGEASDPLAIYQRQAGELYAAVLDRIDRHVIELLFNLDI